MDEEKTAAVLVYGIALGDDEAVGNTEGPEGAFGPVIPGPADWIATMNAKVAAAVGLGLTVVWHGCLEEPSYILAADWLRVSWEELEPVHPAAMAAHPTGDWDVRLKAALDALGLEPEDPEPGWFLTAALGVMD